MSEKPLRECPFCGREGKRNPGSSVFRFGCSVPSCAGYWAGVTEEDWNTRAPSPELDRLRERCAELEEALREINGSMSMLHIQLTINKALAPKEQA